MCTSCFQLCLELFDARTQRLVLMTQFVLLRLFSRRHSGPLKLATAPSPLAFDTFCARGTDLDALQESLRFVVNTGALHTAKSSREKGKAKSAADRLQPHPMLLPLVSVRLTSIGGLSVMGREREK